MEDATIQKLWIDKLFCGTKVVKLMSYVSWNLTLFSYIKECLECLIVSYNNYSRKFWYNSKSKCDYGKAILDGIELRVSKVIYKDTCMKVHGL